MKAKTIFDYFLFKSIKRKSKPMKKPKVIPLVVKKKSVSLPVFKSLVELSKVESRKRKIEHTSKVVQEKKSFIQDKIENLKSNTKPTNESKVLPLMHTPNSTSGMPPFNIRVPLSKVESGKRKLEDITKEDQENLVQKKISRFEAFSYGAPNETTSTETTSIKSLKIKVKIYFV